MSAWPRNDIATGIFGERQARKLLQVGEGHAGEPLPCPGPEPGDIGAVGPLGVRRSTMQPECNEMIIGRGMFGFFPDQFPPPILMRRCHVALYLENEAHSVFNHFSNFNAIVSGS